MPDLLLELFSEEIPARMQAAAAKDAERLVVGALSDRRGLMFEGVKAFAGPRAALTLAIAALPAKQPDVKEEREGPARRRAEKRKPSKASPARRGRDAPTNARNRATARVSSTSP